jgi:hypothetical protein
MKTEGKSCIHCKQNTICAAYKGLGDVARLYAQITTAPKQFWDIAVIEMAKHCKHFEVYAD